MPVVVHPVLAHRGLMQPQRGRDDGAVPPGRRHSCTLVAPVLEDLVVRGVVSTIYREDDDDGLAASWRLGIETVPTLLRGDTRIVGWSRAQWEEFTGVSGLGEGLPEHVVAGGGLTGMRERAMLIGAALDVESTPGEGVTVTLRLVSNGKT